MTASRAAWPQTPPPETPPVLLAAPVNATWAANHTDHWADLGFSGILFEGILDGLAAADDGAPPPEALLKEIRYANTRLAEAGVNRNFLRLPVAPEAGWFSNRDRLREALDRFGEAGEFCRAAGLRGLAIDTRPDALFYGFGWDGYNLDATPAAVLREGAKTLGRRGLRAFIRACPDGDLLILADPLEAAGPLWFDLFDGLVSALGAAESLHIHLLLRAPDHVDTPEAAAGFLDRIGRRLEARLSPESQAIWRKQGSLALGLAPVGFQGRLPITRLAPDRFRRVLASAKAHCGHYVWIDAPDGGWCYVSKEDAAAYPPLAQQGRGALRATAPMPAAVSQGRYAGMLPTDGLRRVGPTYDPGAATPRGYVYASASGAAVLFWSGLPEGYREAERNTPIRVTDLVTGEGHAIFPRRGVIEVAPTREATLVDGLPLGRYAVPASLWMAPDQTFEGNSSRQALRFGCVNTAPVALEAKLEILAPPHVSLGRPLDPLALEAGAATVFERLALGRFRTGDRLDFKMVLVAPGATPIMRDFAFHVAPPLRWRAYGEGPPAGPPVLLPVLRREIPEAAHRRRVRAATRLLGPRSIHGETPVTDVVWVGRRGDVRCYDSEGGIRWERRYRRIDAAPVKVIAADGMPCAAVVERRGRLRLLDADGNLRFEESLREAGVLTALTAYAAPGIEGEGVCVALDSGVLVALHPEAEEDWTYRLDGKARLAPRGKDTPEGVLAASDTRLVWLDGTGNVQWQATLPAAVSALPRWTPRRDEPGWVAVVPGADGSLSRFAQDDGAPSPIIRTGSGRPITDFSQAAFDDAPEAAFLAADGAAIYAVDTKGAAQWQTPLAGATRLSVCTGRTTAPILVTAAFGAVHGLSAVGAVVWTDRRPAADIVGAPAWDDLETDGIFEAIFATGDHALHVIELPVEQPIPKLPAVDERGEAG